jgi:hypothetical protein
VGERLDFEWAGGADVEGAAGPACRRGRRGVTGGTPAGEGGRTNGVNDDLA